MRPKNLPEDFHEFVTPPGFTKCWVSRDGRVVGPHYKLMTQHKNAYGYPQTSVYKDTGEYITKTVHRLVALAFIPNPLGLPQVNHIDGDPGNPHVSNLEWVTPKQNVDHAWAAGLCKNYGEGHYLHSVDAALVRRLAREGMNNTQIAKALGLSRPHVSNIVNMKTRKTG